MLVPRMTPMSSTEAPIILHAHDKDSHLRATGPKRLCTQSLTGLTRQRIMHRLHIQVLSVRRCGKKGLRGCRVWGRTARGASGAAAARCRPRRSPVQC